MSMPAPALARRVALLVVLALVAAGCARGAGARTLPRPSITVTVVHGARRVAVRVPSGSSVATVLSRAGMETPDGHLRAASSGRDLGPNGHLARFRIRGRTVGSSASVGFSTDLEVIDGTDTTEATKVVRRTVAPGGLPDALQYVQFAGVPGVEEATVGVRSGEVVDRRTLQAAVPAHRATGKVVALTFDDGPDPSWTPAILAVLKDKGVPATFCEVGEQSQKHPELTKRIVEAGHQLCNHTEHHVEGLESQPRDVIDREILGGRDALAAAAGSPPPYYRPPGGSLAPVIYDAAGAAGESVLYWSIDPRDWKRPSAHDLLVRVVSGLKPGGIILLHDGGGNRDATIAALPAIIDFARALGYTFTVPVSRRSQVG